MMMTTNDGKKIGYASILTKQLLSYNIVYQLSNKGKEEDPYKLVEKLLTSFEIENNS